MDEPLSNLDASLRVKTRTEIKRLQRELKITVVFVTHDQEEAMVMSDRIAVMNNGVLQQFDEPMKIYRAPMNVFVAGFIGSPQMNLLPGEMAPGGHGSGRLVGLRPHDLAPTANGGSDAFTLTGELALIEPAGPLHYLDVDVGGQLVKATCVEPNGLFPGATVTLSAPVQAVHLFDRESGLRVNA
jgi:ABC-type sugar transport system ATPase subunit